MKWQAITIKTLVGGVLPQTYLVQFCGNHSRIILGSNIIYDGDEQRGWQWLEEELKKAEAVAHSLGLSFERVTD